MTTLKDFKRDYEAALMAYEFNKNKDTENILVYTKDNIIVEVTWSCQYQTYTLKTHLPNKVQYTTQITPNSDAKVLTRLFSTF
jgi:hypothetical protein